MRKEKNYNKRKSKTKENEKKERKVKKIRRTVFLLHITIMLFLSQQYFQAKSV